MSWPRNLPLPELHLPLDKQRQCPVPHAGEGSLRYAALVLAITVVCTASPAARLHAVGASSAAVSQRPRGVPPFWNALAQCETGGRWDWGKRHRPSEGHTYEGGLGFYWATWRTWARGAGVNVSHAYNATPAQQVRVGRYGLRRGGYWGCLHSHPEIYDLPGEWA